MKLFKENKSSRRQFILGGLGVAGALVVGWGLMPMRQRLYTDLPAGLIGDKVALNGWLMISADGRVTVMLSKSEMGQGVMTALPMLVAEELDVPLFMVDLMQAPLKKIYGDTSMMADGLPFHPDDQSALKRGVQWLSKKTEREIGLMVTGGSSSVKDSWLPMREAGAAARARLIAAAAAQWQVSAAECKTLDGFVLHASGKKAAYGELAVKAAALDPVDYKLKNVSEFKLIGRTTQRLDAPAKIDGSAEFGMDVKLPGMLYAAITMCPYFGGSLTSFDAPAGQGSKGVKRLVQLGKERSGAAEAIAVVADTRWHATLALKKLSPQWAAGAHAGLSSPAIFNDLGKALDTESGFTYYSRGDVAGIKPAKQIHAEYSAPYLAHAAMEPVNCTAQFVHGRLKLWVPTQAPSVAVSAAARASGLKEDQIDLHITLLGGGFGRRLDTDMIVQAVMIARELDGAPVQLVWQRKEDMAHDFYRPAAVVRLNAALDESQQLLAWESKSASGSAAQHLLHRAFGLPAAGPDKTTVEGLFDHPYEVPNQKIAHVIVDSPVPLGTWRSVGHSHNAFFKESFMDEVAHAAGADPVAYRRQLLTSHPRHLSVLNAAVAKAGQPAKGNALGVALHQSFGSIVAQVAEVSVTDNRIHVHKVSCAVDCGIAVNPEGVRQQIESGIVFGLSAALHGEITLEDGRIKQSNFHDYPMLTMAEMPEIVVEIVDSQEAPEGVGEPGTPPIAPAVANAVFNLTGQRLRSLPLRLAS